VRADEAADVFVWSNVGRGVPFVLNCMIAFSATSLSTVASAKDCAPPD
jgi:hypothetical protein